ncbi:MFS transporter [Streptomyces sp. NPDC058247]|uniref:MFS transporter n=1 Tax=Streptomyces sp. NPDC058247 TaxID=3346401 RepID=UPI0036F19122
MTYVEQLAAPARDSGRGRHAERPVGWAAVLRLPYTARLLGGTLMGRLPLGMAPVVLLLAVRAQSGSTAAGAALAAAYGLAVAAGQPLVGRLVDRVGQTAPTIVCAVLSATAFGALAVGGTTDPALACAGAVLAGVTAPSLEANLRTLWPLVVPTGRHLRAAYTLDSGSQELVYVAGPLLATVLTAAFGPAAALAVTGLLGLGGSLTVILAAPSRTWRPAPMRRPSLLGALRPRGMRMLLTALVAVGTALGALNVGAVTAGTQFGAGWLSGALPAAMSLGALGGSALFASLPSTAAAGTQLQFCAAAFALAWCPLALAEGPWTALACAALPGLLFGPLLTCCYQAIDLMAAPGTVTESYSWLVASFGIGTAAGTGLAGPLGGPLALPAAAAALALVLLLPMRGLLRRARPVAAAADYEAAL